MTCINGCVCTILAPAILCTLPGTGNLEATRLEEKVLPVPVQPKRTTTK